MSSAQDTVPGNGVHLVLFIATDGIFQKGVPAFNESRRSAHSSSGPSSLTFIDSLNKDSSSKLDESNQCIDGTSSPMSA